MSWRHRIAIVVLAVLTGLPVSGTLCAMLCASAAATTAHHGSGTACDDRAMPSSGSQLGAASDHDCSTHDAGLRQAVMTTASRADGVAVPSQLAAVLLHGTIRTLSTCDATLDYRTPHDSTLFTASPLVLRV